MPKSVITFVFKVLRNGLCFRHFHVFAFSFCPVSALGVFAFSCSAGGIPAAGTQISRAQKVPQIFLLTSCRIKGSTWRRLTFSPSPQRNSPKFSEATTKKLHDLGSFHPLNSITLERGVTTSPFKHLKFRRFFFSRPENSVGNVREFQVAIFFSREVLKRRSNLYFWWNLKGLEWSLPSSVDSCGSQGLFCANSGTRLPGWKGAPVLSGWCWGSVTLKQWVRVKEKKIPDTLLMEDILHQLRLVVEIPWFTTGFSTIPGGCLGFLNHQ